MSGIPTITLVDILDILLVAAIIYLLLLLIRGTRGIYMLVGLLICGVVLWLANLFELRALGSILGQLFSSLILVIVVIFQHDIRRVLTKVGRSPFFKRQSLQERETLEELVKTSVSLANKKIGALIAIERGGNLVDHVEQGVPVDSLVNKDLLTSIFLPVSPLHDGAAVIQGARVVQAGCLLPLSMSVNVTKVYGTRHRAAIGLTEETDAVVIVVSEERGVVSLAVEGKIEDNLDAVRLRERLLDMFGPQNRLQWFRTILQNRFAIAKRE